MKGLNPPSAPTPQADQGSWGGHLSTGLGCAIDGHAGHPPEVGHVHLSNSAECIWGDEIVRPLWGEQQAWDPREPTAFRTRPKGDTEVYKALLHTWSLISALARSRVMEPTLQVRKLRFKDETLWQGCQNQVS